MADDDLRALERAAAHDPQARVTLTALRLRSGRGVVWLWVELPERLRSMDVRGGYFECKAVTPSPTLLVEVNGFQSGGEIRIGISSGPDGPDAPPAPKRGWALACLSVEDAAFGRETIPASANLAGPLLLDIESGQLVVPCTTSSLDSFVGLTIPMPEINIKAP